MSFVECPDDVQRECPEGDIGVIWVLAEKEGTIGGSGAAGRHYGAGLCEKDAHPSMQAVPREQTGLWTNTQVLIICGLEMAS